MKPDLKEFSAETHACPQCKGPINIVFDPGELERKGVPCPHCHSTEPVMKPLLDANGKPQLAMRRFDPDGNPTIVEHATHYKDVGCRTTLRRKGH